jgi:putative transposase
MQKQYKDLIKSLAEECNSVEEIQGKLKVLFKDTLQEIFEAEIENHLGYNKHNSAGDNTGNSRNGYTKKTVKTIHGPTEIKIPRDRKGLYEPQIVRKHERTLNGIEEQIVFLYAKGMSTRDIEDHLQQIYGLNVSPTMISRITDKVLPMISDWQTRPLDPVYPIVYLDAIHFKVKVDNRIISKAAYTVLGINTAGIKDMLGIWIGERESASFWLGVCTDLKSRGVEDIIIACIDGLSGFSQAIQVTFPKTDIQLCVIHQIRNSVKYVSWKEKGQIANDLKSIYNAINLEQALLAFEQFKQTWGTKHPVVIKSWERNWNELTAFYNYPLEIRRIIYTTNSVESYHRQLRKVTKTKTSYPTDEALRKMIYLATMNIIKSWTRPVPGWSECLAQLTILFEGRIGKVSNN